MGVDLLQRLGVFVLQTLYEGGLNYHVFKPFIATLHRACVVHQLTAHTDYRELLFAEERRRSASGSALTHWCVGTANSIALSRLPPLSEM